MTRPPALDRPFRLIAFDWDGTAVATRSEDAARVRGPIARLLRQGVIVVVVTGTNVRTLERQLSGAISGPAKRNLYLATDRGSEVYGFDQAADPVLLSRRAATADEERMLTEIADELRERLLARSRLEVRVVYDRLNRRKVDLIPLDGWRDPPKAALGDLLLAVETRLKGAGIAGGIGEVVDLGREIARSKGLAEARITSDIKHVEIGLTDKADSIAWVLREIARPKGIAIQDILVGGDEFGPVAGLPGSDSRMLIAEASAATFVSVGPEPGGVPAGVLHLGGGPERFRELLAAQAAFHPVALPADGETDAAWLVVEEGYVPAREHEVESLLAIGNGYLGSRASLAEGSASSAPATFVAGLYDTTPGSPPALARAPDWADLSIASQGNPLRLDAGETIEHRRLLDMRQGTLWREWRQRDGAGRITRVRGLQLASIANRHLLVQSVELTPENWSGALTLEARSLSRPLLSRTASGTVLAFDVESAIDDPAGRWAAPRAGTKPDGERERWAIDVEIGKSYRLDRVFAARAGRAAESPLEAARNDVKRAVAEGVEAVVRAHRAAWQVRWEASDVAIEGDPDAQRALRFAVYHLVSAANPDDEHVSIGARALTGAAYKGHVFWDTEIFMLPFFTLTYPAAARALLTYRYYTLPAARARAARAGHRGALYAWESAETGDDVTPAFVIAPDGEVIPIRVGDEELHISADIAYGVWSYWEATGDEAFLLEAGTEILIETARFWASRAEREDDGRYHIRGVIGPDEYHESVDDNAYTNGMARFNLEIGAEAAALMAERWPRRWEELRARLHLDRDEPGEWLRIAGLVYSGLDPRTGIIEQFQGYFGLEEIDLAAYEPRSTPMDVLLGRERILRSKVIKQADVVMLLYLLWDRFPAEIREANFRYYEPRTGHGSSLSPPVHAAMAARLGDLLLAERYFRQTAEIDLANNMGNSAGGVHAAALGGLWQAAVFGFAGLHFTADGPEVRPRLPAAWRALRLAIQWRGRRFPFDLAREAPREDLEARVVQ